MLVLFSNINNKGLHNAMRWNPFKRIIHIFMRLHFNEIFFVIVYLVKTQINSEIISFHFGLKICMRSRSPDIFHRNNWHSLLLVTTSCFNCFSSKKKVFFWTCKTIKFYNQSRRKTLWASRRFYRKENILLITKARFQFEWNFMET